MSTSRIGPTGSGIVPADVSGEPAATERGAAPKLNDQRVTDAIAQADQPKVKDAHMQSTGSAFTLPTLPPVTDRRARGGDSGAWTERTRTGILFAADNAPVGRELLSAWNRGFA